MSRSAMRRRSRRRWMVLFGLLILAACTGKCVSCADGPGGFELGTVRIPLPGALADLLANEKTAGFPDELRLDSMLSSLRSKITTHYSGYSANDPFDQCSSRDVSSYFSNLFDTCRTSKTTTRAYNDCIMSHIPNTGPYLETYKHPIADVNYCNGKYAADGTFDEYETCLLRMERCSAENPNVWAWVKDTFRVSTDPVMGFSPAGIVVGYQGESEPQMLLVKVPNQLNKWVVERLENLRGLANLIGQPIEAKTMRAARNLFAIDSDMRMQPFSIPSQTSGCGSIDFAVRVRGFTFWITRLDLTPGESMTSNPLALTDPGIFQADPFVSDPLSSSEYDNDTGNLLGARIQIGHFNVAVNISSNLPDTANDVTEGYSRDVSCEGKMELLVDFKVGFAEGYTGPGNQWGQTGEMTLTPIAKKLYINDNGHCDQTAGFDVKFHDFLSGTVNNLGAGQPPQHFTLAFDDRVVTQAKDASGHLIPPFQYDSNAQKIFTNIKSARRNTPRHFLNFELQASNEQRELTYNGSTYAVESKYFRAYEVVNNQIAGEDDGTLAGDKYSFAVPLRDRIENNDTEVHVEMGCKYKVVAPTVIGPIGPPVLPPPVLPPKPISPDLPLMAVPIERFSENGTSLDNLPQITVPDISQNQKPTLQTDLLGAWEARQMPSTELDESASRVITPTNPPGGTQVLDPLGALCQGMLKIRQDSLMVDLQGLGLGNQITQTELNGVASVQENGQWFYTNSARDGVIKLRLRKNPRMTIQASTGKRPLLTNLYKPSTRLVATECDENKICRKVSDLLSTGKLLTWRKSGYQFESMSELPTISLYGTQADATRQATGQGMPLASWSVSGFDSRDELAELPYGINRDNVVIKLTYPKGSSLYPPADRLTLTLGNINMIDGTDEYLADTPAKVRGVLKDPTLNPMREGAAPTEIKMEEVRKNRQ